MVVCRHGSLHAGDQALEPLIATTSDTIVFPPGTFVGPWFIEKAQERRGRMTLVMSRERKDAEDFHFDVFQRVLPSQVHGALASRPFEMAGLVELAATLRFDVMAELRAWLTEPERLASASARRALFLLVVPKRRTEEGEDESWEAWYARFPRRWRDWAKSSGSRRPMRTRAGRRPASLSREPSNRSTSGPSCCSAAASYSGSIGPRRDSSPDRSAPPMPDWSRSVPARSDPT